MLASSFQLENKLRHLDRHLRGYRCSPAGEVKKAADNRRSTLQQQPSPPEHPVRAHFLLQKIEPEPDLGQRVFYFVSDAGGQTAHRFHLCRPDQLPLSLLQLLA